MLRIEELEKILKERERSSKIKMMMEQKLSSAKHEAFCAGMYWTMQQIEENGGVTLNDEKEESSIEGIQDI